MYLYVIAKAAKEKYAVAFFNAVNIEMARAVIETAEKLNCPVIIGSAQILEVDGASQTRINTERRARYQPGVFKVYSTPIRFYVNQY